MPPGEELHGPAVPRRSNVHLCENCVMAYRRPYLDQFTGWTEEPILHASAVQTGARDHYTVSVAELHLAVVQVVESGQPLRYYAHRTVDDAVAAAERTMALPDSRGIMRAWIVERRA